MTHHHLNRNRSAARVAGPHPNPEEDEIMTGSVPAVPDFAREARRIQEDLVRIRQEIHAEPELGLELPHTQDRVIRALEKLPLEISTGDALSSVTAVLRGGRPGATVLLRGDMDALPMRELTGLPFASNNGAMHSCGHDLHTAGLIGAAMLLAAHREDLPGNVVFMFQPGEEGQGGARLMIDEGVLDASGERAIAAYAIHVAPGPRGVFATKHGCATASSNQMFITVKGRGGHGSQPQRTLDPVPVAAQIILGIQAYVARQMNAFDPVVVSVTQVSTGDNAVNVIPDTVTLGATIRSLTDQSLAQVRDGLKGVAEATARAYGMEVDYDFVTLYPPTINNDQTTDWAVEDMRGQLGEERVVMIPEPMMGSEDFAFVSAEVPGTFVGLFATPPALSDAEPEFNHSPRVIFDDTVLGDQAAAMAAMAYGRLAREEAARSASNDTDGL